MPEGAGWRLGAPGAAALAVAVSYLTLNIRGDIAFALELRGVRLAGLVTVATAIGVSTVLFQSITDVFGQTALIFALGGLGFASLDPRLKFLADVELLMALSLALVPPMLNMTLLLLAGVVAGVLFRSLAPLLSRLIDRNDLSIAQVASFTTIGPDLPAIAAIVTALGVLVAWRARHMLDVLALGRDRDRARGRLAKDDSRPHRHHLAGRHRLDQSRGPG